MVAVAAGTGVAVYQAGPTGFGLARACSAAGIDCQVLAPSKLIRPSGDRVKTDARDARHLARLLHLGEVVSVAIPSAAQEAARDLVAYSRGLPRRSDECPAPVIEAASAPGDRVLRRRSLDGEHEQWLRQQPFDNVAQRAQVYPRSLDQRTAHAESPVLR